MALTHPRFLLSLLSFFFLTFIVHSKLELYPPDCKVLLVFHKDTSIEGQNHAIIPCNFVGISCQRRMSTNACFLRVRRHIAFKSHLLRRDILSPEIGELLELKELSLPNTHCLRLVFDIPNNRFSGKVPLELLTIICLQVLDLSFNKFSGSLISLKCYPNHPKFYCKVPCSRFLNIFCRRKLKGPLPKSSRINSKRYIFVENQIPLIGQPPSLTTLTQPLKPQNKKTKIEGWIFWVGILAGGLIGLSFSIFLSIIMLRCIKEQKVVKVRKVLTTFTKSIHPSELAFLKEEDNLASLGNFIGKGGCGEVYLVELPTNKAKIAVKKITQPYKNARELTEEDSELLDKKMRQIKQEIEAVGLIRHRNILPLLAHVPRTHCHYLVYEYMKNGSLEDLIYQVSKGEKRLSWVSRHRIALGIAEALKYMHMDITPRIIHRDLKPANILLDENMESKVTDFGLSKAFPEINTHLMSNHVAGTVGYMAPEYVDTLMFSEKSDVYSFGVILAALVMGKLPTDDFFQHTEEMTMVKWMRNVFTSGDPRRAIDPNLIGKGHENVMLFVLKIACACTSDEPNERPSSDDVRIILDSYFPVQAGERKSSFEKILTFT